VQGDAPGESTIKLAKLRERLLKAGYQYQHDGTRALELRTCGT